MTRIRRLAIGLMTVSVVLSAVYATGAFSSLIAQREANIRVTGDASSYLSLQPASGPNGEYATLHNGKLSVALTGALGGAGAGVNRNAVTVVRDIFTITNQGSQPVGVWLTDDSAVVTFEGGPAGGERSIETREHAVSLKPGQTITVGIVVDTRDYEGDETLLQSMILHADSDVSGTPLQSENSGRDTGSVTPPPDPDGDGLSTAREQQGIDSSPKPGEQLVQTSPFRADTDGDGLTDSEEIGQSDPTTRDTDGDLLDDSAERTWHSDPTTRDTDGDGLSDLIDPEITKDSTPPLVAISSRRSSEYLIIDVQGNGHITDISIRAHYPQKGLLHGPKWVDDAGTVQRLNDEFVRAFAGSKHLTLHSEYKVSIDGWGRLNERPDKYWLNITDDSGHTISYLVTPDSAGDGPSVSKMVVAGSVVTFSDGIPYTDIVGILGLTALFLLAPETFEAPPVEKHYLPTGLDLGGITATYQPGETDPRIDMPVRLPSGQTYEAPDSVGEKRRFGEEQLVQLPGITHGNAEETVGEILKAPSAIRHQGEYTIVIGDNPHGPGGISLYITNGVIVTARQPVHDDARNTWIQVPDNTVDKIANRKSDWDHNQIGNSEHEVEQNIRKIIQHPDEIWKDPSKDRWMYAKKMHLNGREVIVTLFVYNDEVKSAFVPTHEHYDGYRGYSDDHAKWYIKNQKMIKRYIPGDEITSSVGKGDESKNPGSEPDPTT